LNIEGFSQFRKRIEWAAEEVRMAQMTPEVSKLLERALSLSVEEQEALADSLISNLGGKVDEGVQAAWDAEIAKRIADLDSGRAKTIPWTEVRKRNLAKLPDAH
jgi:putative addiction module component (TIGR02574 family)